MAESNKTALGHVRHAGARRADLIKNFAATLHRDEQVTRSERHLRDMVRELIADAVAAGDVRDDVPPDELATYCLHSITAAGVSRPRLRSIGSSQ